MFCRKGGIVRLESQGAVRVVRTHDDLVPRATLWKGRRCKIRLDAGTREAEEGLKIMSPHTRYPLKP